MKKTVLVVDDDLCLLELLRLSFERQGFNVEVADTTAAAFAIVTSRPVDAVLTDYQFTESDGLELCRAITQFARHLPVWVMSGCYTLTREEAISAGAITLFPKPFHTGVVAQELSEHFALSGAAGSERVA